jgi:hypothetical protein
MQADPAARFLAPIEILESRCSFLVGSAKARQG